MEKYNFYVFWIVCVTPLIAAATIPAMRAIGICNSFAEAYKIIKKRP